MAKVTKPSAIKGTNGNDLLQGTTGRDLIEGKKGNDTLFGGADSDTLDGGEGSDVFIGGAGNDTFVGGGGIDLDTADYSYDAAAGGLQGIFVNQSATEFQGIAFDTVRDGFGDFDSIVGVRNIIGTEFGDTIYGGNHANTFQGGGGDDFIYGNDGSDTLLGGDGADTLNGGSGSDSLDGGTGTDLFIGLEGNDTFIGGGGPDSDTADYSLDAENGGLQGILVNQSASEFQGIAFDTVKDGFGTFDYIPGVRNLIGTDAADTIMGGNHANIFDGRGGDDYIFGNDGRDNILGGSGNDTLDGGAGQDTLIGGDGNDTLILKQGADVLDGGDGVDTLLVQGNASTTAPEPAEIPGFFITYLDGQQIIGGAVQGSTAVDVENATVNGLSASYIAVWGTEDDNVITINGPGTNTGVAANAGYYGQADGGGGNDTFNLDGLYIARANGGDGNDTYNLGTNYATSMIEEIGAAAYGDDTINLGSGQDTIYYSVGPDGNFRHDIGQDVVTNFTSGTDVFYFYDSFGGSAGQVATVEDLGAGTTTIGAGDTTIVVDAVGLEWTNNGGVWLLS